MSDPIDEAIKAIQKLKQDRHNIIIHTAAALERRKSALMAYKKCLDILKEIKKTTHEQARTDSCYNQARQ